MAASCTSEKKVKSQSVKSPVLLNGFPKDKGVRAEALGWSGWKETSYEGNQSFPKTISSSKPHPMKMEWVKGDGLNFISFSTGNKRGSNQSPIHASTSRDDTWLVCDNLLSSGLHSSNSLLFDTSLPFVGANKAVFTVLLPSTQILVVNSVACKLLDYSSEELCSLKLETIIHDRHKIKLSTIYKSNTDDENHIVFNNGKVIELLNKDGSVVPVSLFLKKINSSQRCLVIAEPVDRRVALLSVDRSGNILTCDEEVMTIFQYDASELIGADIRTLIPNIALRDTGQYHRDMHKQKLTGRTKEGASFPLCLLVNRYCVSQESCQVVVWVYANLSGLIVLQKDLTISNCNHHFTKLLFGIPKNQLLNQSILKLIPNFCNDLEYGRERCTTLYQSENSNNESSDESVDSIEDDKHKIYVNEELKANGSHDAPDHGDNTEGRDFCSLFGPGPQADSTYNFVTWKSPNAQNNELGVRNSKSDELFSKSDIESNEKRSFKIHTTISNRELQLSVEHEEPQPLIKNRKYCDSMDKVCESLHTSGERRLHEKGESGKVESVRVRDGHFSGYGRHGDGTHIDVIYRVKMVMTGDKAIYCVWVSRDPWEIAEGGRNGHTNLTLTSSFNSTSLECSMTKDSNPSDQFTRPSSASIISQCDEILTAGEYSEHYNNLQQIGKGAFGYVKMAYRNSDGFLVITKFIKKKKINSRSWVMDPHLNLKVPLEVSLLTTLEHPNIVQVLDVFHNESFFQLVMEKHGAGLDLFEFIDRKPKIDEKLDSFIFRQMVSAVHYLDSLGILHRDIKDENVIINEKFQVKLIDFGSATFMSPDRLFSTFYGTVEYCSPEVLQGNKYKGPEVEVWALGVTLYVLAFGENPFYDVEETMKGEFTIPCPVSAQLHLLLHAMLEKDVSRRTTIHHLLEDVWINQSVDIDKYRFEDVVRCYHDEAYPPRYISEYCMGPDKDDRDESGGPDMDDDRTVASSNSFCSLNTIENLDCHDDCCQEQLQPDTKRDSLFRLSVPSYVLSSTPLKRDRDRITKSVSALHRTAETFRNHPEKHSNNNSVQKRFSLDLNTLKRLNSSPCSRHSDFEIDDWLKEESNVLNNEEVAAPSDLEREIIEEFNKLTLLQNGNNNDAVKPASFETILPSNDYIEKPKTKSSGSEDSNNQAGCQYFDTIENRAFEVVDFDCYWDAEDEKYDNDESY